MTIAVDWDVKHQTNYIIARDALNVVCRDDECAFSIWHHGDKARSSLGEIGTGS